MNFILFLRIVNLPPKILFTIEKKKNIQKEKKIPSMDKHTNKITLEEPTSEDDRSVHHTLMENQDN
jgi:hypothetical protein